MKRFNRMKRVLLLGGLLLSFGTGVAQRWENRVGVNLGGLPDLSLDVGYEALLPNQRWSLTAEAGFGFGTVHHELIPNAQTGETTRFWQYTRGPYARVGLRHYMLKGTRIRPFAGTGLTVSMFRRTNVTQLVPKPEPWRLFCDCKPEPFVFENQPGTALAMTGAVRMSVVLTRRMLLDVGVQKAWGLNGTNSFQNPMERRFFTPGVGVASRGYVQAVFALKYRLHP